MELVRILRYHFSVFDGAAVMSLIIQEVGKILFYIFTLIKEMNHFNLLMLHNHD